MGKVLIDLNESLDSTYELRLKSCALKNIAGDIEVELISNYTIATHFQEIIHF